MLAKQLVFASERAIYICTSVYETSKKMCNVTTTHFVTTGLSSIWKTTYGPGYSSINREIKIESDKGIWKALVYTIKQESNV